MSDDHADENRQFTEETRQRVEDTGRALAEAVLRHTAIVAGAIGPADHKSIFASNRDLGTAALAYGHAHMDHSGTFPTLDPYTWDEEALENWNSEPDEATELVSGQGVTLIRRVDLIAHDVEALIEAGRAAYLEAWPDQTRHDAEAYVDHMGTAIYQIGDARGSDALLDVDGLTPTAGMTVIHAQETLLDEAALDAAADVLDTPGPWPIFATTGEVLNSSSELW